MRIDRHRVLRPSPSGPATFQAGELRQHPWMLWGLLPLGFASWVPVVAGIKARRPLWTVLGIVLCLLTVAGFAAHEALPEDETLGGALLAVAWIASTVLSLALYLPYRRRRVVIEGLEAVELQTEVAAQLASQRQRDRDREYAQVERQREQGRRLVREDPRAALERGVGRPDRPGAHHCHLVDVNHAPRAVLGRLPDVDDALARRIVASRAQIGQFSSVADMGFLLDLDPDVIDQLERVAIAIDA